MNRRSAWAALERRAASVVADGGQSWDGFWQAVEPTIEAEVSRPRFLGRVSLDEEYRRDVLMLVWEKLQERSYGKLRAFFDSKGGPGDADRADPATAGDSFRRWLFVVIKRIGIDYMRSLPEYIRYPARGRSTSGEPSPRLARGRPRQVSSNPHWVSIVQITTGKMAIERPDEGPIVARQMLEFLDRSVPDRQRQAVSLIEQGAEGDAIAQQIGLSDEAHAERVIRRGRLRLKYRPALHLWSQGFSDKEIAVSLDLDSADEAHRVIKAAKELLKRHFRHQGPAG